MARQTNGVYVLGFLARYLQSNGDGNILSTPNLLTLDNEEAKIVIGQNVPFVTGQYTNTGSSSNTVNPFQTIERKDVGLTLKVKPPKGAAVTVANGKGKGKAGINRISWNRKLKGKKAPKGTYKLTINATAAGKSVSSTLSVKLK